MNNNRIKNYSIKLLLSIITLLLIIISSFNTISSYENISNSNSIAGLISILPNNMVRIKFDPMGGSIDSIDKVVTIGDKYGTLPTPTKEGYIFDYWYLDSEDNKITSSKIAESNKNIILKAKYINLNDIAILKENAFIDEYHDIPRYMKENYDFKTIKYCTNNYKINAADEESKNPVYVWRTTNNNEGFICYYSEYPIYLKNEELASSKYGNNEVWKNLEKVDFSHISGTLQTNTSNIFQNVVNLKELDISGFNTSNIVDMNSMFKGCENLTSLDLSNFDTSNVIDMSSMFYGCSNLISLVLTNFNTSNVTNMSSMFYGCRRIKNLDLSNFDVSNVTNMSYMFANNFDDAHISICDYEIIDDEGNIYDYCVEDSNKANRIKKNEQEHNTEYDYGPLLETLNISSWNVTNVKNMSNMFENDTNLLNLDLSNWNTKNLEDISFMFKNCVSLKYDEFLYSFNTNNVKNMAGLFMIDAVINYYGCEYSNKVLRNSSLESVDLSLINTSNVTDMSYMFSGCNFIEHINLSYLDTSNVIDMSNIFSKCNFKSFVFPNINTSSLKNASGMFDSCKKLITLDLSNLNTSNVNDMSSMFSWCSSLRSLDLSRFNTKNVTDMFQMFNWCYNLSNIYVSERWDIFNVISSDDMFYNCSDLPNYNSNETDKTKAHYNEGGYLTYKAYNA